MLSATTSPTTWPTCCTVPCANTGSSPAKAASIASPGMSAASTRPRTPASASAAVPDTLRSVPCATGDRMGAAYSVPRASSMSSM